MRYVHLGTLTRASGSEYPIPASDLRTGFGTFFRIAKQEAITVNKLIARMCSRKNKLGSISKQGDRYLRSLFTAGARAVIRYAKIHGTGHRPWLTALLARRPAKVAAVALANKIARMAWATMLRNERYKEPAALSA
jgi:hypothetical protein